jgi:5-oxopent-3-ene-1,2,5-tricarboxylate decarboxylase/2-hydroxyhepta-2,4-diene-1,7-dioate isomerase
VNSVAASAPLLGLAFDVAPWRPSGTVVAALLNDPAQVTALGDAVHVAPYKAAPRAPVLGVKPRNTWCGDGDAVEVPADPGVVQLGPTLAIVIGRPACRVKAADALAFVAGYTIAQDLALPHDSHYRPAVRQRVRDGFCPVGPRVVPASRVPAPDALALELRIDGVVVQRCSTAGRVRGVAALVADVSAFMTLQPGDLLLLGPAAGALRVRAGQVATVAIEGLGTLTTRFVAEAA